MTAAPIGHQLPKLTLIAILLLQMAALKGRVWYDLDLNGVYNAPPDIPLRNTPIVLQGTSSSARKTGLLGATMTDDNGNFQLNITKQQPGAPIKIYIDTNR